jgi:hypothetical protein
MNDTVRGLVLLFSVLLWLPFLRPTLDGSLSLDEALLRYAGTLLLAWAGGAGLDALVRGYAAQGQRHAADEGGASDEAPRRRAEDHAP